VVASRFRSRRGVRLPGAREELVAGIRGAFVRLRCLSLRHDDLRQVESAEGIPEVSHFFSFAGAGARTRT
jgi:hypothetical protein